MPFDLIPLSALSLEALADICRQDDHPQVEAARDEYHERTAPTWAEFERGLDAYYDRVRADGYGESL